MDSMKTLYRIGHGPSSSHTMGPRMAAEKFAARNESAASFRVTLHGSLAATGKGHFTDRAIIEELSPREAEIIWRPEIELPGHPNGMILSALDASGSVLDEWTVYSVGGGEISDTGEKKPERDVYEFTSMREALAICERTGQSLWELVYEREGDGLDEFLNGIWDAMSSAIDRGLEKDGVLPGGLGLPRKAALFLRKARMSGPHYSRTAYVFSYALAASEENASGEIVVTAPTCGSCGVLPAVLRFIEGEVSASKSEILRALATAGLVGNIARHNASVSGAEVGCQGEVGVACAMASAAVAQILGGSPRQIEYAAEMGLEHHLGLTCDPIKGLVQIPCIERNAHAAVRALTCADYSLLTDGAHRIPYDEVVAVMKRTGCDLPSLYRETSGGGLAQAYNERPAD